MPSLDSLPPAQDPALPAQAASAPSPADVAVAQDSRETRALRPDGPEARLEAAVDSLFTRLGRWAHAHPRRLAGGTVAVLAGFAVTAFGVAPLAPDAAQLPRRQVIEAYQPEALDAQLDALAAQPLVLQRHELTRSADSADAVMKRLGLVDAELAAFLRTDVLSRKLWRGRAGKLVEATADRNGHLQRLVARYPAEDDAQFSTHFSRLTLERDAQGHLQSRFETAPLGSTSRLASGRIRSSLFAATDEAGIPDAIASQMAEVFSTDIDFHRELRKGDTFSVVYESLTADGEPVTWNQGAGRVLAAHFINAGREHSAVLYTEPGGRSAYFDLDGRSKRRAFLASPLAFSRVTSGFAMRFHPIQQTWKAHLGVDYGAPTGTPVRAVGDGVIEVAGPQNGYGNVVQIRHGGDKLTVYAHLSRIDVKRGQRIAQGERIGAVGATGWATGPHLHFEFRVAGIHRDPLTIAKAAETLTLDAAARPRFAALAQGLQAQLKVADALDGHAGLID